MNELKDILKSKILYTYAKSSVNEKNIVYGIDNNYIRCAMTSILSFKIHNPEANIVYHIISSGLTNNNTLKLKQLACEYNLNLIIYEINKKYFDLLPTKEFWSEAMYFRFIIPNLLNNVDKIFYFDADIICLKNIDYLFNLDLQNNIIAAIPDIKRTSKKKERIFKLNKNSYFNSGVLIIDRKKWNEYDILPKVINCIKQEPQKYVHPDQDALNVVLKNHVMYLSKIYNCINIYEIKNIRDIAILHFANHPKPWNQYWHLNAICNSFTKNLYKSFEEKTPCANMPLEKIKNKKMIIKVYIKYILYKLFGYV